MMRKANNKLLKIFGTEKYAKDLLYNDSMKLTGVSMAKKYSVGTDTICRWLKQFNLQPNDEVFKKSCTGRKPKKEPDKNIITKEFLLEEYNNKHQTQSDIAKNTGIAKWTIQRLFKEYDIRPRKLRNKNITLESEQKFNDINWFKEQYINQNKTIQEIANELNMSFGSILKKIKKFQLQQNKSPGNYFHKIFESDKIAEELLSNLNKTLSLSEISNIYNVDVATISIWFKKLCISPKIHYCSIEQKEIFDFISQYEFCILNDRNFLNGREIDVFIPKYNLGIELNGIYWHSEKFIKNIKYHWQKTDLVNKKGGKLYQIYDYEWNTKKDIIKSMLFNAIGKSEKISARKTNVEIIETKMADLFYEKNHIQGKVKSSFHVGLKYKSELVSLMSFSKSRFDQSLEWELTRFASALNMQIIGGASKLLSFFIKTCSPINIVSYADKRYSNGNLYKILGFNLVEEIKPDYKYIDTTKKAFMLERKEQFWHRNMSKRLAKYDPTKSEKENTQLNKIYRIYDCGKLKFVWFPTTP